jgi:hypothetical protein
MAKFVFEGGFLEAEEKDEIPRKLEGFEAY